MLKSLCDFGWLNEGQHEKQSKHEDQVYMVQSNAYVHNELNVSFMHRTNPKFICLFY